MHVPWRKRMALLRRKLYFYPPPEPMPRSRLFYLATGLVALAVLIFCVYFIALLTTRYDAFGQNAEDFGIMDQALWNLVHGHFLHQTICNIVFDTNCVSPAGVNRFAIHFEPLLFPISLLYLLGSNPKILLVLQTLVVASGAFPAFWLARLRLRNELAAVAIAVLYLLYPAQQQALVFDFHAVTFTAAFLLYMLYFMYTRRTMWMIVFAVLAMACKEQMPLVVVMIGLWSALLQMRRSGWLLVGIGLLWFWLATAVIMPHASPTGRPLLISRYDHIGSPSELLSSLLLHPRSFFQQYIWEQSHRDYLVVLLSPALYLPLLAPWVLFMALPSLAINLLSSNPAMYSGIFHYNAEIVPILIFSTIEALVVIRWLTRKLIMALQALLSHSPPALVMPDHPRSPARVLPALVLVGTLGAIVWSTLYTDYYFYGQLPYSRNFSWPRVTARTQLTQRFLAMIPATASISTQNKLVPHLSQREHIYLFPYADDLADYILLDIYADPYPFNQSQFMHEVQKIALSGHYGILAAQDGFLLFKRGLPPPGLSPFSPARPGANVDPAQVLLNLPAAFCSRIYPDARQVTQLPGQLKVDFTITAHESVRLLGYTVNAPDPFHAGSDTLTITTYWQASTPLTTPLRLLLFLQGNDGQSYLVSSALAQMTWCPSTMWQPGKIVRIQSSPPDLQWTKVPKGLAHMSIALLPLVQSSSTIMDVQSRLPLHVVAAPGSVSVDYGSRALQLMSLDMTN